MKRLILACAGAVLITIAALLLAAAAQQGTAGPAYSVEALRAALARTPAKLVGHTIYVRGGVLGSDGTGVIPGSAIELRAAGASHSLKPPLLLHPELGTGLVPTLRQFPLLGRLLAQPQTLRAGVATYQIRIVSFNGRPCRDDPFTCYYGLLVDASPDL